MSLRPAWAISQDPISKNINKKQKTNKQKRELSQFMENCLRELLAYKEK
jgi:hypothetical protein